ALPGARPPRSSLFPYTTLFRSAWMQRLEDALDLDTGPDTLEYRDARRGLLRRVAWREDDGSSRIEGVLWADARPGGDALLQAARSEEHTSELQSRENLVCRLLL